MLSYHLVESVESINAKPNLKSVMHSVNHNYIDDIPPNIVAYVSPRL